MFTKKIVPMLLLLVCATASADGVRSAFRDFDKHETALAVQTYHGQSLTIVCQTRKLVEASLARLERKMNGQLRAETDNDRMNIAADLRKLHDYCDEMAMLEANSGEKMMDDAVGKRGQEMLIDLDNRTYNIDYKLHTLQQPAR